MLQLFLQAVLVHGPFQFAEQAVQGFQGGELLAFHLAEDVVEAFQGDGHLQVDQVLFDRVQGTDGAHARRSRALACTDHARIAWDG